MVIQDPNNSNWIKLEFPIKGITSNIGAEIEGIKQALQYSSDNYRYYSGRVIILTDCKFAINSIINKWDSDIYNIPIADCQKLMRTFYQENVPEIYWTKGHSGIPGNDEVDIVANNARRKHKIYNLIYLSLIHI